MAANFLPTHLDLYRHIQSSGWPQHDCNISMMEFQDTCITRHPIRDRSLIMTWGGAAN